VFEAALTDSYTLAAEDKGVDTSSKRRLAKLTEQLGDQRKYGPGGPWWSATT
jgi:hypothetical protein